MVLVDELRETRAELAASQHEAGVVAERERVAQEIHDTLAQGFLAIVTQAQVAAAAIGRYDAAARERLTIIEQVARENLAEARGLVAATAPEPLRGVGLAAALHNLGRRFATETAIEITVQTPDDGVAGLSAAQEVVLVRAVQEALNNVRRHSGASAATIRLSSTEAAAVLVVADNGIGISPEAAEGYGLTGMRDRVQAIGGAMTISSAGTSSGNGTTIRIELPQGTAQ